MKVIGCMIGLWCWASLLGSAQVNLVPNFGFEQVTSFPSDFAQADRLVGWYVPPTLSNRNTPDLFSTQATGNVELPFTFLGTIQTFQDSNLIGLTVDHEIGTPNSRQEALAIALSQPLEPLRTYRIRVAHRTEGNFSAVVDYHPDQFHVGFHPDSITYGATNVAQLDTFIRFQKYAYRQTWDTLEALFFADKAYTHLALGSFIPGDQLSWSPIRDNPSRFEHASYNLLDSVVVEQIGQLTNLEPFACEGDELTFLAPKGPNPRWFRGDLRTPVATGPTFTTLVSRDSASLVAVTDSGNAVLISPRVQPNLAAQAPMLPPDTLLCADDGPISIAYPIQTGVTVSLDVLSAPGSFVYTSPDSLSGVFATTGQVELVTRAVCDTIRDTLTVLYDTAFIRLPPDTNVCTDELPVTVTPTLKAVALAAWTDQPLVFSPLARTIATQGTYTLAGVSASGCPLQDSLVIGSSPVPDVALQITEPFCQTATITPVPPAADSTVRLAWADGYPDLERPVDGTEPFTWVIRAENACGDSLISRRFEPGECPVLAFPSAFSPNGDGLNDVFAPSVAGLASLRYTVYNRWGATLFVGTLANPTWTGENTPAGIYLFEAAAQTRAGTPWTQRGSVTVVR